MQDMPFSEQRIFPRFTITIPLTFFELNSNKPLTAQTHDVSSQGLCIVADRQVPSGSNLDMRLQMMDNNERICIRGKVIWSSMIDPGKYRIGIKLEDSRLKPIPLVLRTIMALRKV